MTSRVFLRPFANAAKWPVLTVSAVVAVLALFSLAGKAFAADTALQGVSVEKQNGKLVLQIEADGPLAYKVFKLEDPLRLAVDIEHCSASDVKFPIVVNQEPLVQIAKTPYGKGNKNLRLEVILSGHAAYEIGSGMDGLNLSFTSAPETIEVGSALSNVSSLDIEELPDAVEISNTDEEVTATEPIVTGLTVPPLSKDSVLAREQANEGETPAETPAPEGGLPPPDVSDLPDGFFSEGTEATPSTEVGTAPGEEYPGADAESTEWGAYLQGAESITQQGDKKYQGKPISLNLKDADLLDILRNIGVISGFNIVVDPGVQGKVTIHLERVPWDQALDIILKNAGLGRTFEGNVMRVASLQKLKQEEEQKRQLEEAQRLAAPLYTEIIYLSYANAGTVAGLMNGHLSPRGVMGVDTRTNSIILTDIRIYVEHIKTLITILDRRTRQVTINTRIVTATKSFTRSLGLSYSFLHQADAAHGNNTDYSFPYNYQVASAVNLPKSPEVISGVFGDILDTTLVNVALHAAESDGSGKVIANPKITTSDNVAANISSGVEVPYILAQGNIQVPIGGGAVDTGNTQLIQFRSANISVQVTPHITNDDWIDLLVNITNNTLGSGVPPSINTNVAKTEVLIKDGDTFVIGGFKTMNVNQSVERIPLVHKIPVLGWLFKAKSSTRTLSDLLIFITPSILPDEPTKLQSREDFNR